jgi:hypothetical protein
VIAEASRADGPTTRFTCSTARQTCGSGIVADAVGIDHRMKLQTSDELCLEQWDRVHVYDYSLSQHRTSPGENAEKDGVSSEIFMKELSIKGALDCIFCNNTVQLISLVHQDIPNIHQHSFFLITLYTFLTSPSK